MSKLKVISVEDLMAALEEKKYIIIPKDHLIRTQIKLLPFKQYRATVLNKTTITLEEISAARLWGDLNQSQVHEQMSERVKKPLRYQFYGEYHIPRRTVRRVALELGVAEA
tara:strand:+ start:23804 stop:24136 length:333 start_codon:yes stop_codon:yes gene_type:complete